MATRSTIGIRQADGTIKAIYCHWDGYPAGVGAGLSQNYNSKEQAEALIALGGFSSLMETLEETKAGAYGTESDSARTFKDTTDWVQNFNAGEEYFYLWNPDTNQWTYSDGEKMFLGLKTWEFKEDSDISFWHCGRPAYWEGEDIYCSKCQVKFEEVA